MDEEEIICFLGALSSENYFSDVDSKIKLSLPITQYFSNFCRLNYDECLRICDLLLMKIGNEKMHKYYWNMKACTFAKMEKYKDSLDCIKKCIELDADIPKYHTNKAILMMKCGKPKIEFMEPLEKAISSARTSSSSL